MKNTIRYDLTIIIGHGFVRDYSNISEDDAVDYIEKFLHNNTDILNDWNREEEFDLCDYTYPFKILCNKKNTKRLINIVIIHGIIMRNIKLISRNNSYKTIVKDIEQLSYRKLFNYKKSFQQNSYKPRED